ncbi:MAG: 2-oxo acid dehydrogenase subunit E2, partial [Corynebacterium sp.]|uniref:2-oxo acid dehydrogenase subunit E2 n=1 Tax=Corynebacterium sp. TaxID=1720 RepID=UPI0026DF22B2
MSSASTFGPNEWLVDDMFQQFQKDPQSVDKEWRELFEKNGGPSSAGAAAATQAGKAKEPVSVPSAGPIGSDKTQERKTVVTEQAKAAQDITKKEAPAAGRPRKKPVSPIDRAANTPAPEAGAKPLRGLFKAIAKNMDESLEVPTATSVRDMPVKLMFENRAMVNDHLARTRGGKISFTHIIGYAMVKAIMAHPDMNVSYEVKDGKPSVITPEHINIGLAIDLPQKDGSRALVVAAIKETENMAFDEFIDAYEDIVERSRVGKLTLDDYQGVTVSLTNPGGIGTRHSVPRLTKGQGTIIGVG